jgi:hypothetical protein
MAQLTDQGLEKINELSRRYGVSTNAVMTLQSLLNSNGSMAQFDHGEFGGSGQWMPGGMTMVGDMFNHGLKAKVDGLCSELSQLLVIQADATLTASFQSQSQSQVSVSGRVTTSRAQVRSVCSYPRHRDELRTNGGQRDWVSRAGPARRINSAMPISTKPIV